MEIKKPKLTKPNPHKNSGLNYEELWEFYPSFFDKCSEILSGGKWSRASVQYVKDVLEYLEDWDCISWKQFSSIMTMQSKRFVGEKFGTKFVEIGNDEWLYRRNDIIVTSPKIDKVPTTDYQIDKLHELIFQTTPYFYEECEQGMVRSYNKFGQRIWLYPTN